MGILLQTWREIHGNRMTGKKNKISGPVTRKIFFACSPVLSTEAVRSCRGLAVPLLSG